MMTCARPMLEEMAAKNNFEVTISDDTALVNDKFLSDYRVFVMLQQAPFDLSGEQQLAVEKFIQQGKGWVGIHAAGLTGRFFKTSKPYWEWFQDFMGGVTYSPHPKFQRGTLVVEDQNHPITKGVPGRFEISDEWYEFDKSPRENVHVLASADESTYTQNKPMGDHPIIWTNPKFHRMAYIGIGHDSSLCRNENFKALVKNAILWASEKK